MMIRTRALAALAFAMMSSSAMAQLALPNGAAASNVVSFGDSLSDRGSLFALSGQPPAQIPGAPAGVGYFQGQFSNGPVWASLLAGRTPAGGAAVLFNPFAPTPIAAGTNVNFAVAGATTTAGPSGPLAGVAGLNGQVAGFLGAPRNGAAALGPNTVTTVWIGGNDIANGLTTALTSIGGGTPAATAQATYQAAMQAAAASAATSVGQLAAAGARTIVVINSPDVTVTPRLQGTAAGLGPVLGPQALQLGGLGVATYNGALAIATRNVAAAVPAANIIQVDIAKALNAVVANPAAFGFANATQCGLGAFGGTGCTGAPSASPDTLLFWDNFHPTAAGHRFVERLVADYLNYGTAGASYAALEASVRRIRLQADQAAQSRQFDTAAFARFGIGGPANVGRWNWTFTVDGGVSDGSNRARGDGVSARILMDRGFTTDARGGLMVSYTRSNDRFGGLRFGSDSFSLDAYASWTPVGGAFVNGRAGLTVANYADIRRDTLIAGVSNRAQSRALGVSGTVDLGYAFLLGRGLSLSPYASLRVSHASIDGFRETAGVSGALVVGSQSVTRFSGDIAARLDAVVAPGVIAHALVGYTHPFSRSGGGINVSILDNTAQAVTVRAPFTQRGSVLLGAGVTSQMSPNLDVSIEYRGAIGTASGRTNSHGGRAAMTVRF